MSFVGLPIEHQTARLLSQIEIPGNRVPLDHMHVTVLYLGEDVSINQIAKAVVAAYKVTSLQKPFTLKTSKIKCFPCMGNDIYPIIARITSPELCEFYDAIRDAFDKAGVEYSKKFTEFRPHVTLSYASESINCIALDGAIQWAAHEAVLYGGDFGDDKVSATFPFTLGTKKEGYLRAMLKTNKKTTHK